MEPIRIAQMMTDMNFGGVEMVVMNYYRHIDKTKFQFDFYALEGSTLPQKDEIEKMGGRVYVVPKYTKLPQYEKTIIEKFKENDYKIVHSHMNTLSVFSLFGAKKAGVSNRICHNHTTAGKGETKKNIMKYALRPFAKLFPTQFCACSKFAAEWLYGKNSSFKVFNNAIDLEKYRYNEEVRKELRNELGIEDKFVIGHIGRFCYQKNHEFLVDVFNEVCKKRKDAVLLLIGEGELEDEIKNIVSNLGLNDKVLFLGRKADAYRYYQVMDLFLLPSRYEGLGMVAIEAQASCLPTICSTEVPVEAKVTDLVSFIPLSDSMDRWASDIIKNSCKNARIDLMSELRKAGYDIKTEAENLADFYSSLLNNK